MKKLTRTTTLKKRRIALRLSQGDLALKVGVAVSSIGGYERGENPLSEEIAGKIAQALDCQVGLLYKSHKKLKNKLVAK